MHINLRVIDRDRVMDKSLRNVILAGGSPQSLGALAEWVVLTPMLLMWRRRETVCVQPWVSYPRPKPECR